MSKNYRQTLNKLKKQFQNHRIEKLRRLKNANSKEFCKIINSSKKQDNIPATLHDLYSFYQETNTNITNNNENSDLDEETEQEVLKDDDINANKINQLTTEEEIIAAAKSLKNNKAGEVDNIVNEHLKSTVNTMLPIKVFNLIFDTSLIPETWTLGQIKPIY